MVRKRTFMHHFVPLLLKCLVPGINSISPLQAGAEPQAPLNESICILTICPSDSIAYESLRRTKLVCTAPV